MFATNFGVLIYIGTVFLYKIRYEKILALYNSACVNL